MEHLDLLDIKFQEETNKQRQLSSENEVGEAIANFVFAKKKMGSTDKEIETFTDSEEGRIAEHYKKRNEDREEFRKLDTLSLIALYESKWSKLPESARRSIEDSLLDGYSLMVLNASDLIVGGIPLGVASRLMEMALEKKGV